jgi:aspartate aminotransferase-like enzyme
MKKYLIPMVPGPVKVYEDILSVYQNDYGSSDLEKEFLEVYNQTEKNLKQIFGTKNQVAIMTGEGMLALWSALKSCINPGDKVLSIATGVFGYGIGDMAKSIGAEVRVIDFPYNETINDWKRIEEAIVDFNPKMITAVHCETPSGTLNPIKPLGKLKEKYNVPLLYVDSVASLGGAPVDVDKCHIDLALGGSQKVMSAPPSMSFLTISKKAWEIIEEVKYVGYDALLPFKNAQKNFYFPYTPYWHGVKAIHVATQKILDEGLKNCYKRHQDVANHCRTKLVEMGLQLYPEPNAIPSPTVTAVYVPENKNWEDFNAQLRSKGLVVGGSYGPLAGKIFRLGHMGSQADMDLVNQALEAIACFL